jgi:preprotein translocase subunit SecG
METLLIVVHYFICFFLIIVILLQAGKGADIGAVFGGASQTVFGGRGPATFLNKMTAFVALAFLVTSIWLAQISKTRSVTSVIDKAAATEQTIPAQEAAPETAVPEAPAPETAK